MLHRGVTLSTPTPTRLDKTIGFLGAGNMAEALIRGLIQGGVVGPERILASHPLAVWSKRLCCGTKISIYPIHFSEYHWHHRP